MHRAGRLVWIAAGFAAAVLGAEYLLPVSGLPYIAAALAVLCFPLLFWKNGRREDILLLLLSAAVGFLVWRGYYDRHIAPCEALAGQELAVTARVTDYPAEADGYVRLSVKLTDGAPKERAYFYLYADEAPELEPGDIIAVHLSVVSATERNGRRVHTYTAAGKCLIGYIRGDIEITGRMKNAWIYFPLMLGERVKELCRTLFPDDTAAFMTALLTGDKAELYADAALYGSMRASGVLHVVAVSGLHVSVLVELIQMLFGRGKRTGLLCLPVMAAFVFLSGCGASVVRAAVMEAIVIFAPVVGRERDGPSGLSAALLLLLLINPMAAGSAALQLSFSCMLGFVAVEPGLSAWMRRRLPMKNGVVRILAKSVGATFCASVFSLPVAAAYFGAVPLFAAAANLLTLPVVTFCFGMGYAVCAVGALLPAVGAALGYGVGLFARWCLLVYKAIAAIPFACLYTVSAGVVVWLVFSYAVAIAWYILRRRGVRILAVIPLELCVIGLCAVLMTGGFSLGAGAVTVLDVGQGECVALTDGSAAVIVDCGGSGLDNAGDVAADWLLSQGKTRVDALVLTHLHEDHANGVETLLARMPVDRLILPADADDGDGMLETVLAAARAQETEIMLLEEELVARVGSLSLTLMLPQADEDDENERGIVALADFPEGRALVMGDAGADAELALLGRLLVPDVDVLVVGHHGSKTASSAIFLRAAQAETAIVSVGYNTYGHPAEETLERLSEYCPSIRRTDEDGTVTIQMKTDEDIYG